MTSCDGSQECRVAEVPLHHPNYSALPSQVRTSAHVHYPSATHYIHRCEPSPYVQHQNVSQRFEKNFCNFQSPSSEMESQEITTGPFYHREIPHSFNRLVYHPYQDHMPMNFQSRLHLNQSVGKCGQFPGDQTYRHDASEYPLERLSNMCFQKRTTPKPTSRPPSAPPSLCSTELPSGPPSLRSSERGSLEDFDLQPAQSKCSSSGSPPSSVHSKKKNRKRRKKQYVDLDRPGAEQAILQSRNKSLVYHPQH